MLQIGMIGTGGMANAHAEKFKIFKDVKITACCDVDPERGRNYSEKWMIPRVYTDYRELLAKEELDGVAVVTPDIYHAPISMAAINKGLAVLCEKPMATTLDEARQMVRLARRKKVINMVNFSYRHSAAVQAAAQKVRNGEIGNLCHVEASYLQSWIVSRIWGDWRKQRWTIWRMSKANRNLGCLGDIGCHIYDMTAFICGDFSEIFCRLKNFKKDVPGQKLQGFRLDANDSFASAVAFKSGATGIIHGSRYAGGYGNTLSIRIFGTKGSLEINLDQSADQYRLIQGNKALDTKTWTLVKGKPTPNNHQRFIRAIKSGRNDVSDFVNGLKNQAYLHYSLLSDRLGRSLKIKF